MLTPSRFFRKIESSDGRTIARCFATRLRWTDWRSALHICLLPPAVRDAGWQWVALCSNQNRSVDFGVLEFDGGFQSIVCTNSGNLDAVECARLDASTPARIHSRYSYARPCRRLTQYIQSIQLR